MLRTGFILVLTFVLSLGVSYALWKDDLLNYGATPLPPLPTRRQEQFGTGISSTVAAALEKPLPPDFKPPAGFERTLRAMSVAAGVNVAFHWPTLRYAGVQPDSPVTVAVAGMNFGDALYAVLEAQQARPRLVCIAKDHLLVIDANDRGPLWSISRNQNIRDLAPTTQAQQDLIRQLKADVRPDDWKTYPGYFRAWNAAGQLWVNQDYQGQYDVARYFNEKRRTRAVQTFTRRTLTLTASTVGVVSVLLLAVRIHSRRRRHRLGLCPHCRYDLRASTERCPECGTPISFELTTLPCSEPASSSS